MGADPITLNELKPVPLKRKALSQGDKVRYRVYTSPEDFVAVIADNALLALKISGVANPHRIIRDLPLAENSVAPDNLITHHIQPTAFIRPDKSATVTKPFEPVSEKPVSAGSGFQPLDFSDMGKNDKEYASTIDVAILLKALEEAGAVAVQPEPTPEIIAEPIEEPAPMQETQEEGLSPEEIEKLLNEPRS